MSTVEVEVGASQSCTSGKAEAGESAPRALNSTCPKLTPKFGAEVDNLYSQFARTAMAHGDNDCFGTRIPAGGPFVFESYSVIHARVLEVGSGLAAMGYGRKESFGVYAANSSDFQACVLGAYSRGMVCVPIYDTLGENIVEYEVNHADIKIMFCEAKKLMSVANVLSKCKTLKHVVSFAPLAQLDAKVRAAYEQSGVELIDLDSVRSKGKEKPVSPDPASGDDLAYIMYTSGTTGDPKGVLLTHLAVTVASSWCAGIELYANDRYLSFLPLAHIFETIVEHGILSVGGSIGFFGGNIKLLSEDIQALKPTVFVGVPRVYARFYEKVQSTIASKPAPIRALLTYALKTESEAISKGTRTCYGKILAKLLGAKVHGGCVRLMISGAAPLPGHVHEFLVAAMGCTVVEGYGMTENCANATLCLEGDLRRGHVGPPMPTTEVKLVDVPEMNYTTAENNSGEVCTRGATTTLGYHKNPEETAKVLENGWLHTGDIGRWNSDGTLTIIDRKKNIFKLSQGEYVAAEKTENVLTKSKYISQLWAYGNSFLPVLVSVVTPDFTELEAYAKANGWYVPDKVALAAKEEAKALIMSEIEKEAKAGKLKSFEVPKAVFLEGNLNELLQGFSIENDCLTPTFKLKRPQLLKRYQSQVDAMYTALGEDPSKAKV